VRVEDLSKLQIVKVEDIDAEAAFMQSLIPPKEELIKKESSKEVSHPKQETEKDVLEVSENDNLDEEEQIENENQPEPSKEESDISTQEDDSKSLET